MKRFLVLFFASAILTSTMCFSQISSQIVGTWSLITMKYTFSNGHKFEKTEFKYPPIKIFTKSYYSYGTLNNDGRLLGAGGGKYEMVGDSLIENIDYCLDSNIVGQKTRLLIRIEGNKLVQSGMLPNGIRIEEEYVRIE